MTKDLSIMTTGLLGKGKPEVKTYVGADAGYANLGNSEIVIFGAKAGAKVKKNGFHANAELGVGTALQSKLEMGKEFNIGKNWSIDASVKAQNTTSLMGKNSQHYNYNSNDQVDIVTPEGTTTVNSPDSFNLDNSWTPSDTRYGSALKFNHKGKKVDLSLGVEAGQRTTAGAKLSMNMPISNSIEYNGENIYTKVGEVSVTSKTVGGFYVTPTASVEVRANKHLSFKANADAFGGQAGVQWTF